MFGTGLTLAIRIGAVALVLAVVTLASAGRAEAMPADSGEHAHHSSHPAPQAAPAPATEPQQGGGVHHRGDCHCLSAACMAALPSVPVLFVALHVPFSPGLPPVLTGAPQVAADPPAKPPRP
jgi:hypothetical protein